MNLTETDFDAITETQNGLLLFYKKICPFCKTMDAVLEKFSRSQPEASLFRVDIEAQAALADRFEVDRAPALFVLKNGQVLDKKSGLMNIKELRAMYADAQAG